MDPACGSIRRKHAHQDTGRCRRICAAGTWAERGLLCRAAALCAVAEESSGASSADQRNILHRRTRISSTVSQAVLTRNVRAEDPCVASRATSRENLAMSVPCPHPGNARWPTASAYPWVSPCYVSRICSRRVIFACLQREVGSESCNMAGQRVLYWGSGGVPGWRVMATLKEKKLDFDSKQIQFSKRAFPPRTCSREPQCLPTTPLTPTRPAPRPR